MRLHIEHCLGVNYISTTKSRRNPNNQPSALLVISITLHILYNEKFMRAKVPTGLRDRATKTMTLVSCTSISSHTV